MANPKGSPQNLQHKGRGKGNKNKFTDLKKAFLEAFEKMGGMKGLAEWGEKEKNKKDFYQMISKMLPKEMELSGNPDKPLGGVVILPAKKKE